MKTIIFGEFTCEYVNVYLTKGNNTEKVRVGLPHKSWFLSFVSKMAKKGYKVRLA